MIPGLSTNQVRTEFRVSKYEAFRMAFQARKTQQTQQFQQREKDIQTVAKYWADTFNKAKVVHDILRIQKWMSKGETTMQQAQNLQDGFGPSQLPLTTENH